MLDRIYCGDPSYGILHPGNLVLTAKRCMESRPFGYILSPTSVCRAYTLKAGKGVLSYFTM